MRKPGNSAPPLPTYPLSYFPTSPIPARVFDIQRFSVHDGPGIRTTVFFKGCPLRCAWCQNPESQQSAPQLMLYPDLCMGCGACAEVCPEAGQRTQEPRAERPVACRLCGRCVDVCPTGARRIVGREQVLDEIAALALRDRPYYGARGGVTLSGGEPLAQWPAARALAARLRAEGVHVAIDTSCIAPRAVLEEVPDTIDLVLADLKLVSPERHRHWTGVDNAAILAAIRAWSAALPGRLWISVPVIPGVQDRAEYQRMADFCRALDHAPPVRLIPYHQLGDSKYTALGWPVPAFPGPVDAQMHLAAQAFHRRGVRILEQGEP